MPVTSRGLPVLECFAVEDQRMHTMSPSEMVFSGVTLARRIIACEGRRVEALEFGGATIFSAAVVKDTVLGEHFVNGLASRPIPHFFEPSCSKFLLCFLLVSHREVLL
jgi:hypothetical protein